MLSREEMRQVERSLANGEQDTRDEIGFLLLHQGFADRFFPGTSVLHTRIRYALFVPWIYESAATAGSRGSKIEGAIRQNLIQLAIRLKQIGGEPRDVIGGDKLGQLTSQPPDRSYWSALRTWRLLDDNVQTRSEALARLAARSSRRVLRDEEGGYLDELESTDVFPAMPELPDDWNNPASALHFELEPEEREFLRDKLRKLTRPDDEKRALLARLMDRRVAFPASLPVLTSALDPFADERDRAALKVARHAAGLAAIGRTIYGALVEQLRGDDGGPDESTFRDLLDTKLAEHGEAADHFDLEAVRGFLPELPEHFVEVLRHTQEFVRKGSAGRFTELLDVFHRSEWRRKGQRARLGKTPRARQRRTEWLPARHNTEPLHYRWRVITAMLDDLYS